MRYRLLFLMLMSVIAGQSWGWVVGEKFTSGGILYEVLDVEQRTLKSRDISAAAMTGDNEVTIPATVADPQDNKMSFRVTTVYIHTSNAPLEVTVEKLILSEGIERIEYLGHANHSCDLVLSIPSSLKTIDRFGTGNFSQIIMPNGSNYFKYGTDGEFYTSDGKTMIYHFVGNRHNMTGNVYNVPEGVENLYPSNLGEEPNYEELHFSKDVINFQNGSGYYLTGDNTPRITVDEANDYYKATDGVLYNKDGTELLLYPRGKTDETFTVPAGVKTIPSSAIMNLHIKYLFLNDVEDISLYGNKRLETVTLGSKTKTVFFSWNVSDGGVKNTATGIKKYIVPDENENFSTEDGGGILFNKDKTKLVKCPERRFAAGETYTIPSTVTELEKSAFSYVRSTYERGAEVTSFNVVCNANLQKIGTSVFAYSTVGSVDFSACTNLTSLGNNTFQKCSTLTTLTIPAGATNLGSSMFLECSNLQTINIPAGDLTTINSQAFKGLAYLTNVNIASGCRLTTIDERAFMDCTGLTSLTLPKTVTTIGAGAFSGCTNLATVTFADDADITTIGASAFAKSGLTSITIPNKVTTIGAMAFEECNVLNTLNLSKSVTSISGEAFKFCSSLGAVNVDSENPNYSSINGILLNKDKTTLVLFPPAKANDAFTLLPPSITKLGDYAFYTCTNLKNVVIPNKVTSIGERTFGMCSNLNTITFLCDEMIPATSIEQGANKVAFDDDMFKNIDINVRKGLLETYKADTFYQKFKSISPSFNNATGTEEYIAVSDNAVDLLSTSSTNTTFVVPTSVEQNSKTYNVSMIGDYCLQNAPSTMTEVVVGKNVSYIGAKAFINTNNSIKDIFFLPTSVSAEVLSTKQFELTNTYNEFTSDQNIYVKKSVMNNYKTAWTAYESQIKYQIPFKSDNSTPVINTRYGTFSREFDVDISENNPMVSDAGKPAVVAYAGYIETVTPEEGTAYIRMSSVNCGQGDEIDGKYIPANTGVLLEANVGKTPTLNDKSPENFTYYKIGEKNISAPTGNVMACVTETSKEIGATETIGGTKYTNFVISGGKYWSLGETQQVTIPAHKSYIQIATPAESSSAAPKMVLSMSFKNIEPEEMRWLGDANNDDQVTMDDVAQLESIVLGKEMSTVDTRVLDVNQDNVVDVTDITHLLNVLTGNKSKARIFVPVKE